MCEQKHSKTHSKTTIVTENEIKPVILQHFGPKTQ